MIQTTLLCCGWHVSLSPIWGTGWGQAALQGQSEIPTLVALSGEMSLCPLRLRFHNHINTLLKTSFIFQLLTSGFFLVILVDCRDHPGDKTSLFLFFFLLNEVFSLNHIHSQAPCRGWGPGKACETTALMPFSHNWGILRHPYKELIRLQDWDLWSVELDAPRWDDENLHGHVDTCSASPEVGSQPCSIPEKPR